MMNRKTSLYTLTNLIQRLAVLTGVMKKKLLNFKL